MHLPKHCAPLYVGCLELEVKLGIHKGGLTALNVSPQQPKGVMELVHITIYHEGTDLSHNGMCNLGFV